MCDSGNRNPGQLVVPEMAAARGGGGGVRGGMTTAAALAHGGPMGVAVAILNTIIVTGGNLN